MIIFVSNLYEPAYYKYGLFYIYRHAKVHENAVDTIVTCSYKWPTNNFCVSSMKLTYSSKDSLFHSKSIHIDFKLTTPTVQELWPPQEGLHEQD